jgi:Arc/MetJ-type ribon-helix-helix transcriptional regulator
MEDVCALVRLERCKIEDIKAMEKEGLFENVRLLRTARELNDGMIDHSLEELIHNIEDGPYVRRETRCETMQVADAFRAKRRRAIGTDRIEELVEDGRFSTISDAVEIALEELIHNIEGIPYAMRETRCEIMQVADAFRAKRRRAIGKRWRMPEFLLT